MPPTNVNVSLETFNEIANALEAAGNKVNPESPITLTKDIKIKGPVDYRQVTIRKDVLVEAVKAYEHKVNEAGFCETDSSHFINFLDDVYQYVLTGVKPTEKPTNTKPPETKKPNTWQ